MALLRLLALLSRDADTSAVEKALKQEPALTLNLLRLTNSAGGGMITRITSLSHAIAILGRRQLTRWLQLLLYSAKPEAGGVSPPTRGATAAASPPASGSDPRPRLGLSRERRGSMRRAS